jgi:mannose-6-phosphate isomerase
LKIVEKPWGRELWVAHTERYALKIIEMNKGFRSSLQYHARKHETIYLEAGRLSIEAEAPDGRMETIVLEPGDTIENPPFRKHRTAALEDSRLIEVSTPELDDVVRVEDDYNR